MWITKARFFALGLATAAAVAAGLLATASQLGGPRSVAAGAGDAGDRLQVAGAPQTPPNEAEGGVRVDAPGTRVDVDKERSAVSVTAPHADVRVDPDKGRVQVRAPYVNLDISW
jgi:hypothetical protein